MSWMFKEAEHSRLYLKYRPKYPDNVYRLFADKLKQSYERLPENQRGILEVFCIYDALLI